MLNRPEIPSEIEATITSFSTVKKKKKCRNQPDFQRRIDVNTSQIFPQNRNRWNIAQFLLQCHNYPDTRNP